MKLKMLITACIFLYSSYLSASPTIGGGPYTVKDTRFDKSTGYTWGYLINTKSITPGPSTKYEGYSYKEMIDGGYKVAGKTEVEHLIYSSFGFSGDGLSDVDSAVRFIELFGYGYGTERTKTFHGLYHDSEIRAIRHFVFHLYYSGLSETSPVLVPSYVVFDFDFDITEGYGTEVPAWGPDYVRWMLVDVSEPSLGYLLIFSLFPFLLRLKSKR